MAKAAQLEIEILAKAEQAIAEMDKVKGKSSESFGGLKTAALGAGVAVAGVLLDATKAAMDHETHVAKMAQAYRDANLPMGEMKKSLEENDAAARKTGQSADDIDDAFTKLVTVTHDTTKAHEELATAQDLAAYKGISVADAATAIIQAQNGNTRSLKEMGIATKDASGKQLDQKQIMEALTKATKGQADAYGNTAEGGLKRFGESTDQLKVALGEALLPAIQKIIDALMPLFDWMNKNQGIVKILAPAIAAIAIAIGGVVAATWLWTTAQGALDIALAASGVSEVIIGIAALVAGIVIVVKNLGFFKNAASAVWDALKAVGDWIKGNWKYIVDVLLGPVGIIITNLNKVEQIVNDIIAALARVGKAASDAFSWLGKVASMGGGVIGKALGAVGLSAPGGGGPAPTPVMIAVYATPGDSLPEVVYDALRSYQRRHARPELRSLFG